MVTFNRSNGASYSGSISGTGAVTKVGAGTLSLNSSNTYSGNTTISAGTLKLSGSGSFANSFTISVASGATLDAASVTGGNSFIGGRFSLASGQTLQGTGTVVGAMGVASGATLVPGFSVGTLNTADVSIASGGTLAADIDLSATPGADLLNVTGALALDSSTLNLLLLNPIYQGLPRTFLIAANDGSDPITGTFASINVLSGDPVTLDYAYSGTDFLGRVGDGNDLAVTVGSPAAPGQPGDYNVNGFVDAGDYILWRKYLGTFQPLLNDPIGSPVTPAQYNVWRANFGRPGAGSGSSSTTLASVPEPSTLWMLLAGIATMCCGRRAAKS